MFSSAHYHPMMVHFPMALLVVAFLADLTGIFIKKENCLHKAGLVLQILGTLGVIAAFASGDEFTNWELFAGTVKDAFLLHQNAAILTIWIATAAAIFRVIIVMMKKFHGVLKWVCIILLFASMLAILRTGFLGGNLVINFLMGL
ncbi:MAG: DUF2231 domain-containing protein [Bacteroidota bacterium]